MWQSRVGDFLDYVEKSGKSLETSEDVDKLLSEVQERDARDSAGATTEPVDNVTTAALAAAQALEAWLE